MLSSSSTFRSCAMKSKLLLGLARFERLLFSQNAKACWVTVSLNSTKIPDLSPVHNFFEASVFRFPCGASIWSLGWAAFLLTPVF
jgi:hypothetical protein